MTAVRRSEQATCPTCAKRIVGTGKTRAPISVGGECSESATGDAQGMPLTNRMFRRTTGLEV